MKAGGRYRPQARAAQAERRGPTLLLAGLLLAGIVLAVLLVPRLVEGRTALHWTRYHASGRSELRPGEWAKQTARWAGRSVELLAPLPYARESADLALDVARRLEPEHPAEAAALCRELERPLQQAAQSRWRNYGMAMPLADCQELRARAEARTQRLPVPVAR